MDQFLFNQVKENTEKILNKANRDVPFVYGETTGSSTDYRTTIANAPALTDGLILLIKFHEANGYNPSFTYNDGPEYPIYNGGSPIEPNAIKMNGYAIIRYNAPLYLWNVINNMSSISASGGGSYYGVTSGDTDYIVTIDDAPAPYDGLNLILKVHRDSVVSQMLNFNNYGNSPMKIKDSILSSRKIREGSIIIVVYNSGAWNIVSGGNDIYSIGDLTITDLDFIGLDSKYFIDKTVVDGATNLNFIGGMIESFDPDIEELRVLIDGIEQVPSENYTINANNTSIDLIGKTGVSTSVYTYITRVIITNITIKNEVVDIRLSVAGWTLNAGGYYEQSYAIGELKIDDNVVFSVSADATDLEISEYSLRKVRCTTLNVNSAVFVAKSLPTRDIPCSLLIIR